jgi:hypothetical protein
VHVVLLIRQLFSIKATAEQRESRRALTMLKGA